MSAINCRRNRLAAWLANRVLRIATPEYRQMVRGAVWLGLETAAVEAGYKETR